MGGANGTNKGNWVPETTDYSITALRTGGQGKEMAAQEPNESWSQVKGLLLRVWHHCRSRGGG